MFHLVLTADERFGSQHINNEGADIDPPRPLDSAAYSELPVYSHRNPVAEQIEHTYSLLKSGCKLLTLILRSKAKNAEDIPRMHEAQTVLGSVNLNSEGEVFIRSVTVMIVGDIISTSGASRFLSMRKELYSAKSREGSLSEASSPSESGHVLQTAKNSKFKGSNVWPFSFKLPRGVALRYGGPEGTVTKYNIPASLNDIASKTSIVYQLIIRVKKGMLSSDLKLSVPFEYLPLIRPDAPSILRQLAYTGSTPLLGPAEDPYGWKTLDLLRVAGTLFNTRPVEITCSVSLSSPTCYTRGSPIHIWINISTSDVIALDLLSSSSALNLQLVCTTSHCDYTLRMARADSGPLVTQTTNVASAALWPISPSHGLQTGSRALQGEIIVPANLPPDCNVMDFALEYAVVVHSFKAAGFVPSNSAHLNKPLLKEDIRIATIPAIGPQPLPHSPPGYAMEDE